MSPRPYPLGCLLVLLASSAAHAGAPRPNRYSVSIATAACPTGTPGVGADGDAYGISLSGLRGWKAAVCPEEGETLTGAGSLKVCTYSQELWGMGAWALSPEFSWNMTGRASTADHPCIQLMDVPVYIGLSDRVYVYPSTDFGISGGTTVTVYLVGEER